MRQEVDKIYQEARRNYKKLDVEMRNLNATYWLTLKWLLEVTLGAPDFNFRVIFDPVMAAKIDKRFYAEVTYRITDNDYLIKIFNNNEIAFYPDADIVLAKKITAAFNKWCELIYERVFKGAKI